MKRIRFLLPVWLETVFGPILAASLMRYPRASKTEIAFEALDDLWAVPLVGGTAHRRLAMRVPLQI